MKTLTLIGLLVALVGPVFGEGFSPAMQARINARVVEIKAWAADPVIVQAVSAYNLKPPADHVALTDAAWKALPATSPLVVSFTQNPAGVLLKSKQAAWVAEAFVSDAKGVKVAFLAKPTHWTHAGNPKHDEPMAGKVWQGKVELDKSSGQNQLQVAVPVLDAAQKPIGSLVVGITVEQGE
jgi:hypothetical protein